MEEVPGVWGVAMTGAAAGSAEQRSAAGAQRRQAPGAVHVAVAQEPVGQSVVPRTYSVYVFGFCGPRGVPTVFGVEGSCPMHSRGGWQSCATSEGASAASGQGV